MTYLYTHIGSVHNPWSSPVNFCDMYTVWYCNQIYSFISHLVTYQLLYPSTPELEGTHIDCGMPQQLADVGGSTSGCTVEVLLPMFWWNRWIWGRSICHPGDPCRFAPMPCPAVTTSTCVLLCLENISACSIKSLLVLINFRPILFKYHTEKTWRHTPG